MDFVRSSFGAADANLRQGLVQIREYLSCQAVDARTGPSNLCTSGNQLVHQDVTTDRTLLEFLVLFFLIRSGVSCWFCWDYHKLFNSYVILYSSEPDDFENFKKPEQMGIYSVLMAPN
jgi:hypothetical protein